VHHRHAVGHAQRHVHVVLDEDERDRRVEPEQHVGERHALAARQAGGRLVEEHQLGIARPGHADLELALLAVGQGAHERVDLLAEAHGAASSRARSRMTPSRPVAHRAQVALLRAEHREVEVVLDAQAEEEPGLLVGAAHAAVGPARRRDRADVRAQELDGPEVAGMSPEITLNSVVFPAPFGPRIARRSPGATSRSTSRTASRPPKRRPTPRRRRIGSAPSA
jgi:hypothetical protein